MSTTTKPTAAQLSDLKHLALKTVTAIRDCERMCGRVRANADQLGLNSTRADGEDELTWLSRLAQDANALELQTRHAETTAKLEAQLQGKAHIEQGPRTIVGRFLNGLAQRVG